MPHVCLLHSGPDLGDVTGMRTDDLINVDCKAKLLSERFFASGYGIALPYNSPYKPAFDHVLSSLMNTGAIQALHHKYIRYDECERRKLLQSTTHALTLPEVQFIFLVLGAGLAAAMVTLIGEALFKTCRSKTSF